MKNLLNPMERLTMWHLRF